MFNSWSKLGLLKVTLLLAFLIIGHWQLPQLLQDQSSINGGPFWFSFIWLSGLAATFAVAFSRSLWVRVGWGLLLVYAAGNALSYLYITGSVLNAIEVERLFQDIAFIDETFQFYGPLIGKAVLVILPLLIGILLPPPLLSLRWTRWTRRAGWLPLLPLCAIAGVVYFDGGGDSDTFPQHLNPVAFVGVLLGDEWLKPDPGPRQQVSVTAGASPFDKIVVIMDESVRGDWLDLNTANGIPTGLISQSYRAANFGLTASHANCSAASNLSFRYAVRRASYQRDEATRPSLWAYAKAAGYRTVYLDGQRTNRELQNFMSAQELGEIDELIQHDDTTVARDKDMILVEKLKALLARPERLYIYVNKNGVHFPYEGKYPLDAAPFQPHMDNATIKGLNEGNQYGDGFGNEAFRNSYRNAVAWNTGEFFKRLLPDLDLSKTLLVYSSDHGQNFTKTQAVGFLTHCTTGPAPASEGTVPLVFLTDEPNTLAQLQHSAQRWHHQASQWNVPSSVLQMMGYPSDWLAQQYEPTVFADQLGAPQFISTYFVRFGLQPVWNDPVKPKPAEVE
ncbi:sulfatase-like hydrolase/transferase [Permianibacter sp. IMCC34836]|uniref:sulfatase-like hydrolase/transferase n=1 Tax=Permianibacter fluminis TaxID=2738515 RepID=UPI00155683BF|nr:sulfatase-like hydrolase/transferase [Permianibacter fluminis]NQD35903.1 sulfatase-like hydrolase/transferase [Permianibacter fluminis]